MRILQTVRITMQITAPSHGSELELHEKIPILAKAIRSRPEFGKAVYGACSPGSLERYCYVAG
jgi:hypothetical protein